MFAVTLIAALAGQLPDDAPVRDLEPPIGTMSRTQLKRELARLEEERPGVGGPVTLVSVGGGMALYALIFLGSGASSPGGLGSLFGSSALGYMIVSMMVVGMGLVIPGAVLLHQRKEPREVMGARIDAINERLERLGDRERALNRERPGDTEPPTGQREPPAEYEGVPPQL